jgi:hypothetical protein
MPFVVTLVFRKGGARGRLPSLVTFVHNNRLLFWDVWIRIFTSWWVYGTLGSLNGRVGDTRIQSCHVKRNSIVESASYISRRSVSMLNDLVMLL